jgi:hypothetical protein
VRTRFGIPLVSSHVLGIMAGSTREILLENQ